MEARTSSTMWCGSHPVVLPVHGTAVLSSATSAYPRIGNETALVSDLGGSRQAKQFTPMGAATS